MEVGNTRRGHAQATMEDVARTAGVSLKSVSRVINAEPHVSAKLRARVEAAIVELRYVPDTAARSLAGARSFIIGLLFDNPSPNYTMKVQAGVYRACVEHQYHMRIDTIDSTIGSSAPEVQLDGIMRHSRADGFILTPPLTDNPRVLDYLDKAGVIYVRIAPFIDQKRTPGVVIDDARAGETVAETLWKLGHRRFGLVNGPAEHRAAGSRRDGFLRALAAHDPSYLVTQVNGDFTFEGGIDAGRTLLNLPQPPTAIFATNDDTAAGVMVACSQAGLVVPSDVSVFGFDDSWIAKSVWPYLTTIHQPIEEMAFTAARILLDRKGQNTPELKMLDFSLVERDSVAPPP